MYWCRELQQHFNALQNKITESERQRHDQILNAMNKFEDAGKEVEESKKAFEDLSKENVIKSSTIVVHLSIALNRHAFEAS